MRRIVERLKRSFSNANRPFVDAWLAPDDVRRRINSEKVAVKSIVMRCA
jgi:hypothetical protein